MLGPFGQLTSCVRVDLDDNLGERGNMNFDQNSPTVGEARTPAPFLGRPIWNWMLRNGLAFRAVRSCL